MQGKNLHAESARVRIAGSTILYCLAIFQCFPPAVHAYQAGTRVSASDDTRILRDAWSAFNVKNFLMARQLAEKVRDVAGATGDDARRLIKLVDDITNNNKKRENAIIAITRGNPASACTLLGEIQAAVDANKELAGYYPDLSSLKQKAGGCAIPPPPAPETQVDPLSADYERALRFMEKGRLQEALGLFNRIRSSRARYKDVEQLIEQVTQEIESDKKKSQNDRFDELTKSAGQLLEDGDLRKARHQLNLALAIRPNDPNARSIQHRIETGLADEINEISKDITAFYGGRYAEAEKGLDEFLSRKHAASITALARFYSGAALGSEFLLGGGSDQAKKNAALKAFEQVFVDDPGYKPRWDIVSPKIKDLCSQAVESHAKTK